MSLWQKNEAERAGAPPAADPAGPARTPMTATAPLAAPREPRSDRLVNIGQSIEIKGELTGNEDLIIDGRVEGKIDLKEHNLTIGKNGRIRAQIHANSVLVHGEVVGNITADDKVEIAPSGSVQGDLRAPRVALADGSSFKGSIDMSRGSAASAQTEARSQRDVAMAAKA